MKTFIVCFLIKIVEILCFTQDYPNSEILKPNIVLQHTDTNIERIPEVIAKYIISRKNNTLLTENPKNSIAWNNFLDNNMNNTNAKEISSTDKNNLKKIKVIKSMPYKYIEVIHYVPIKVTTSGGGKKVILDTNSSLDNIQKVIVNKDNVREMQKVLLDGSSNIENNDDLNKVQNSIFNEENLHEMNNLNNMQEVINDGRRNYKDNHTNAETTITDKDILNIDKEALLSSLGYFVRHQPKDDYIKSKIIFIQILHNFVKYLEDRGISGLEILDYLQRQREVTNKGFKVLFTNGNQNSGDYTKLMHLNDDNNLRNEEIMNAIEKQALLSSDNYMAHNPTKDEVFFKNKEIYILVLRDFVKYLIQKGITDLQIMEYLQHVQKEETREEAKDTTHQSINRNEELASNTKEEVGEDVTLNENVYTTASSISEDTVNLEENKKKYEIINNDFTIFLQNLLNTSHKQELKTNLSEYIKTPEADIGKSEDSYEDIENINSYKILEEDKRTKDIIGNLHENISLDNNATTESQTLRNIVTSDDVWTAVTNLPIVDNGRRDYNIKSDFSIETQKEEIMKDNSISVTNNKEDINTEVNKDNVKENKSNTSKPLKLLSELNITNDKLNINNEKVKYENVSLGKSVIPNEDIENHKTIRVQNSTERIPTENDNISNSDHRNKSNKKEDIYIKKDNIDFIDLWKSEKPNLTSTFDIESPKLTDIHTNTYNNEKEDIPMIKDNIDFINLWTSDKPNLTSLFDIESSNLTNIHTNADNKEIEDQYIPMNKDNIDFIDLWTSEKPNLTSIFDVESSKLTNIHIDADNKENRIPMNKDNIDFIDLWTSEKPNLTSVFNIESSKLSNEDINSDNTDALSRDEDINILKDTKDLWTSETPNLKGIVDIKSPKFNNLYINDDKKKKIKHLNYNTKYVNKIEPTTDVISEMIKLRKVLSKLIIVLKLILKELNRNNNNFDNNIKRKLLKNELFNNHQINYLETKDILLIEKFKLINTILALLANSKCNNDLDVQKVISKYGHSTDFNDISLTNNELNDKLILLVKLLQFKGIPQEQMMKIIRISLINAINPLTMRTYQNSFVNNLVYNLQLFLYKSLLSMVV